MDFRPRPFEPFRRIAFTADGRVLRTPSTPRRSSARRRGWTGGPTSIVGRGPLRDAAGRVPPSRRPPSRFSKDFAGGRCRLQRGHPKIPGRRFDRATDAARKIEDRLQPRAPSSLRTSTARWTGRPSFRRRVESAGSAGRRWREWPSWAPLLVAGLMWVAMSRSGGGADRDPRGGKLGLWCSTSRTSGRCGDDWYCRSGCRHADHVARAERVAFRAHRATSSFGGP